MGFRKGAIADKTDLGSAYDGSVSSTNLRCSSVYPSTHSALRSNAIFERPNYNSAVDCWILLKFGPCVHYESVEIAELLNMHR